MKHGIKPYYQLNGTAIYQGDCLDILPTLPSESIDLMVTSPIYNLKGTGGGDFSPRFGIRGNAKYNYKMREGYDLDCDNIPDCEYIEMMQAMLRECWRLLKPTGAIFFNHKHLHRKKQLLKADRLLPEEIPLRDEIVWDRFGSPNWNRSFFMPKTERIFVLAKPGWQIQSNEAIGWADCWRIKPSNDPDHPCPFPIEIPRRAMIATGCPTGGIVLDPFMGVGTTLMAARELGWHGIGIELSEKYCSIARDRVSQVLFLARKKIDPPTFFKQMEVDQNDSINKLPEPSCS